MCDLPKMTQQVGLDSRDPGVSARWWSVCPVSQTWTELPGTLYGVGVGGGGLEEVGEVVRLRAYQR